MRRHIFDYSKYEINPEEYLQEKKDSAELPLHIKRKFIIGKACMAVLMPLGALIGTSALSWPYILIVTVLIFSVASYLILKVDNDWRLCVYALICLISGLGFGYFLLPSFIHSIRAIIEGT